MTISATIANLVTDESVSTDLTAGMEIILNWFDGKKSYEICYVRAVNQEPYPTPRITVSAPPPGITLVVIDSDGNELFTTRKPKPALKGVSVPPKQSVSDCPDCDGVVLEDGTHFPL